MSKKILASIIAMLIGMPFAAHSASGISEKAACKEAMAAFKKDNRKQDRAAIYGACNMGSKISDQTCVNFESNTAQGWAKIHIKYTASSCYQNGQPDHWDEIYTFQRLDQGWKLTDN